MIRSTVFIQPLVDLGVIGLGIAPEEEVLAERNMGRGREDLSVVEVGPALAKLGVGHALPS